MIREDCILNPCTAITHDGCCIRDCGRYEKKENKIGHEEILYFNEFAVREASNKLCVAILNHISSCDEIIHSEKSSDDIKTKAKIQIEKWKFLTKLISTF